MSSARSTPAKVTLVHAKALQVADFAAQAQPVVSLELVAVAGSADSLQVFPAV